jgi:cysteinyl-tRNA synthetase
MYICGPTVYAKAHIGHAMFALVFDIVRRYLEFRGYEVRQAMNYTDVDDKIIERAAQENVDPIDLAERHAREFDQYLADFNILRATVNPRASHEMDTIINMVQGLIDKGYGYEVDGDVYFRVHKDEDYGKLSGRKLEDMQAGARISVDERKENPLDFALWKAQKPGEPAWESPWGLGRPGWHIECSAMILAHLGEQIDIHGGGTDLIFPHHENEIAQTESLTGKKFVHYWMHNGMLQLAGEKMSKSTGNLVTIEDFLTQYEGDVLRFMVLNSSYRNPLSYSDEILAQAQRGLARLRSALRPALPGSQGAPAGQLELLQQQLDATEQGFIESMDDDFNSAGALGHLFELVRVINQARDSGASQAELDPAQTCLLKLTGVLGLRLAAAGEKGGKADPFVDLLVELRTELRSQKLWALSDLVRDRLAELDVVLEDSREGTTWRWKD